MKKSICQGCEREKVPYRMRFCRSCLCDIFGGLPLGTCRRIILDKRNEKLRQERARNKPLAFRSVAELYDT